MRSAYLTVHTATAQRRTAMDKMLMQNKKKKLFHLKQISHCECAFIFADAVGTDDVVVVLIGFTLSFSCCRTITQKCV